MSSQSGSGEKPIILGIDPGKKGAVAALDRDGAIVGAWRTPTAGKEYDLAAMRELLQVGEPAMAGLERVWGMPGEGVKSTFAFGEGFGLWRGLLAGLQVPATLLLPSRWQGVAFQGRAKPKDRAGLKAEIVALARERWPAIPIRFKADWGMADAAWLAECARRDLLCRV